MGKKSNGWADILTKVQRVANPETRVTDVLVEVLENAIVHRQKTDGWRSTHVHPSNLWRGERWWYFYLTQVAEKGEENAHSLRRMQNGTKAHERIDKYLQDTELLKDVRVKVVAIEHYFKNETLNFSGRIDAVVEILGTLYNLEFKTAKSSVFKSVQKSGPSSDYLWQAAGYTYMNGYPTIFLYENKDTQEWYAMIVKSNDYVPKVEAKLKAIKEAVTTKQVPPLCDTGCNTCKFVQHCATVQRQPMEALSSDALSGH